MRKVYFVGRRFGRLVVTQSLGSRPFNGALRGVWECVCDCGRVVEARTDYLSGGDKKSCGCLNDDGRRARKPTLKHGLHKSATYESWTAMKTRCFNQNHRAFAQYGGRGVTICERWLGEHGFENFIADMGPRPDGTSLDRIDNSVLVDGYSKTNCRWATARQQARNRRVNMLTEESVAAIRAQVAAGVERCDIAARFGIRRSTLSRLIKGTIWKP